MPAAPMPVTKASSTHSPSGETERDRVLAGLTIGRARDELGPKSTLSTTPRVLA